MTDESNLKALFVDMAQNEALFDRYLKDPAGVLRERGLSPDAIRALTTGNLKEIRRLLELRGSTPGLVAVIVIR